MINILKPMILWYEERAECIWKFKKSNWRKARLSSRKKVICSPKKGGVNPTFEKLNIKCTLHISTIYSYLTSLFPRRRREVWQKERKKGRKEERGKRERLEKWKCWPSFFVDKLGTLSLLIKLMETGSSEWPKSIVRTNFRFW